MLSEERIEELWVSINKGKFMCAGFNTFARAIEAAVLAEKQEPVAWMWKFKGEDGAAFCTKEPTLSIKDGVDYVPLYTHPQPDLTAEVERLKEINRDLCSKSNSYIVANAQQKERIAELEAQDTEMCDVHAQLLVEHGKAKLHIAALEEAAREAYWK